MTEVHVPKVEDLFRTIGAVVAEEDPMNDEDIDKDIDRFKLIEPAVKDFLAGWKEGLSEVEVVGWLLLYQQQWFSKRGQ